MGDERNNLSLAFKNHVGAKRQAWRALAAYQSRDPDPIVSEYRGTVEKELQDTCNEAIQLIRSHLLVRAEDVEAKVFYTKMMGDYYRYLAEFSVGEQQAQEAAAAKQSYSDAVNLADGLSPNNAIRLGLALNFSVFYFEVLRSPSEAIALASKTVQSLQGDGGMDEDSVQICQLLQENLQ